MIRNPWGGFAAAVCLSIPVASHATIDATNRNGASFNVDLVSSKVKATIGAQWIDVEEDAELQVVPGNGDNYDVFQIRGEIELPPQAQMTGCLFWRGDTVLKGKLRVHATAVQDYNDIVNDPSPFSSDPLLVEKISQVRYRIRAFPFIPRGIRKIRVRYLVPVVARTGQVPVLPLMSQVSGGRPATWTLQTRGNATGLKLLSEGKVWALAAPAVQSLAFPKSGTSSLVWGANAIVGEPRAIFDHVAAGPWAGDYVLFTGKIPDSLARKVEIRSETVILWRWFHPEGFVQNCDPETCFTDVGVLAVEQARAIARLADWITGEGNKVAVVSDFGLSEASAVHPMGDSASEAFRSLKTWIRSVDEQNIKWRVSNLVGSPSSDFERNRKRFASDLSFAGHLFTSDSNVVKHVLVVTVGSDPSGSDDMEAAVDTGLASDVSVASTRFEGVDSVWDPIAKEYVHRGFAAAKWTGVDLPKLEFDRAGKSIVWMNRVRIPRSRNFASATISIPKQADTLAVYPSISKGADGNWLASVNVHDVGLGRSLKWKVFDDQGEALVSWTTTPTWVNLAEDSIVPRLWAVSPMRASLLPGFESTRSLGDVFGFVDEKYSLLALASDSLRSTESTVLADSGVPFLTSTEIFGDKYKSPDNSTGVRRRIPGGEGRLRAVAMGNDRVRIEFGRERPRLLQILDVEGRLLCQWSAEELVGKSRIEWTAKDRSGLRKGLILVRMVLPNGVQAVPLALP